MERVLYEVAKLVKRISGECVGHELAGEICGRGRDVMVGGLWWKGGRGKGDQEREDGVVFEKRTQGFDGYGAIGGIVAD